MRGREFNAVIIDEAAFIKSGLIDLIEGNIHADTGVDARAVGVGEYAEGHRRGASTMNPK